MIDRICCYVTDCLIEGNIVKEEERHLYYYCIEGFIEVVGNLLITLIIGAVLGRLLETIIFLCVFVPLRSLGGGYHVKDGNLCFVLSIALFMAVMLSAAYSQGDFMMEFSKKSFIVSLICILVLSPVDSKNKRLDAKKKKKLKIAVSLIAVLISCIFCLLLELEFYSFAFVISNTFMLISVLLILGCLKNGIDGTGTLKRW